MEKRMYFNLNFLKKPLLILLILNMYSCVSEIKFKHFRDGIPSETKEQSNDNQLDVPAQPDVVLGALASISKSNESNYSFSLTCTKDSQQKIVTEIDGILKEQNCTQGDILNLNFDLSQINDGQKNIVVRNELGVVLVDEQVLKDTILPRNTVETRLIDFVSLFDKNEISFNPASDINSI